MGQKTFLMKTLCLGAACCMLGLAAETLTWKGGSTGTLGTATNWTPEQVPQDGDVLLFPDKIGAVTAENDLTVTLGGLDLRTTGAIRIQGSQTLRLNGLVTSSATIKQNNASYPADRVDCPVELVGNTHFCLTGVPASTSNPAVNGCRNLDIYGCISGAGDLVVSNRNERGVSLRLYCPTNTYTGKTVLRSFGSGSGGNYAALCIFGSLTNGPSCLGVNREIDVRGRFTFDADNLVIDRDFVLPWGNAVFQVNKDTCRINANSTIRSPAGSKAQTLEFRNTSLIVDAYLSNVSITRNDRGWITFTNPTNDIRNSELYVMEGMFIGRKLAPMGQPSSFGSTYTTIRLGKTESNTCGGIGYDGEEDATIDAPIKLDASAFTGTYGSQIDSAKAGATLTVAGAIGVNNSGRPHQRLHLTGAGNGVLSGSIEKGVHFVKEGSGTWTIASESVATTGKVEVAAGTLLIDTTIADAAAVTVAANAALGGSGTISSPVTFATGSRVKAGTAPLTFAGPVTWGASVTIDTSDLAAGAVRTVFVCTDSATVAELANKAFVPTDMDVLATVENGALTVRRKGSFTWTGAVDAMWDTSTANWRTDAEDSSVFVNDDNVSFTNDATPADRRAITLGTGIRAANVTVGGANGYSFSGAPFAVAGTFEKTGAGTLTISNKVDAGFLHIGEGTFVAATGADFGTSPVSIEAAGTHEVHPSAPIAGALTVGKRYVTNTIVHISGSALTAENGEPVTLVPSNPGVGKETVFEVTGPGVVTNREMRFTAGGGRALVRYKQTADTKGDFVWLGDIVCANRPMVYFYAAENAFNGNMVLGELGRTTIAGDVSLMSFRSGGLGRETVVNSLIDVTVGENGTFELNVGAYVRFMAPSNRWSSTTVLNINTGTAILGTNDTLDVRHGVAFGTSDKGSPSAPVYSVVDLNGFDQSLTRVYDDAVSYSPWAENRSNSNAWQIVRSATPATLTLTGNGGDVSRLRFPHTQITGAVTIVKSGTAALNLCQPNFNTGSWILQAGTTTLLDSSVQGPEWGASDYHGTFGASTNIVVGSAATLAFATSRAVFAKDARLSVEAGGKVQMDADQVVDYLSVDGRVKKAGTYTAAKNPEFVTGAGTLTVRVGEGGTLFILR